MPNAERNIKANPHTKGSSLDDFVKLLNQFAPTFGLVTEMQWAFFLAQIAHESAELRYTEELASGAAYDTGAKAKALGNTTVKDGDGQKYKGRGYIQITGHNNYKAYSDYLVQNGMKVDLLKTPELLAKITGATKSALWFFWKNRLHRYAPARFSSASIIYTQFKALTRAVNGGYNGLADREKYLKRAVKVLLYQTI